MFDPEEFIVNHNIAHAQLSRDELDLGYLFSLSADGREQLFGRFEQLSPTDQDRLRQLACASRAPEAGSGLSYNRSQTAYASSWAQACG